MELDDAKSFLSSDDSGSLLNAPPSALSGFPSTPLAPTATYQSPLSLAQDIRKQKYLEQNQLPGVPLDIETGISPMDKLSLGFRRQKEDQLKYLQNQYGPENVRLDAAGDAIVRVVGPDGKPKDLKVNEAEMHAKDLLGVLGVAPEVAGGILALKQGRGIPGIGPLKGPLGLQRDVALTALGGETAGALKDIGVSSYDQGKFPDFPKIVKERGEMALGDVALGELSLGAGKVLNFMSAPLAGSRGPVQFDALAAQKYFRDKYGIDVPLSIGESTGSPLISRTEAFMEKLPGGSTPFKELKGEQEEALRQLQGIMMGKTPLQDEPLGRQMIDALMQKVAPAEAEVSQAAKTLGKVGTQQIENVIGSVSQAEREPFQEAVGKDVRNAIIAKRDAAKAEADRLYGAVRAAPGGEGRVFEAEPLQERFKDILEHLPTAESTSEIASPIVDVRGNVITRTETGQKVLKEFVPPNVLARLKTVVDLKDAKFSLSDLQQMRREVYDDIAKGEGVPGLGTHYLNDIGKAITEAIDQGIDSLPSGDLKTALAAANKFYKERVVPFNRVGLTELFRNPDEFGHISDAEVVSRAFSGGPAIERYNLMKEVLGEASPQFSRLKRAMLDNLIESSRIDGERLIDPKRLVQNLTRLRTDTPSIANDIFGGKINELFRQAKFLDYAPGDKIDAQQLQSLLRDKTPTAQAFKTLIDAERKRDELYTNEVLRDVGNGSLGRKPLNPSDFVNRFLDKASPSDVKQAIYMLRGNRQLVEDIRAKTVEKIFRDAARAATPGDISKLIGGDPTRIVSGTSVFKQIESPAVRQKVQSILGPDIFKDLTQYISLEAAGEAKERSFAAAGGLAAGMQIASLTRRGPFRYLYEATKDFIVSSLLTRAPLRQWLSRVPANAEPGAISLILTSPQFLQQVAKEFPGAKGSLVVNSIKQSVDRWTKEQQSRTNAPVEPDTSDRERAKQFLNQ